MSLLAKKLIQWHESHGRKNLPWQKTSDPYHIWLSEVMLQQTQVATVIPYFKKFLKQFPDIRSLAHARQDDVMGLWSGLGYYSRARNLYDAANIILTKHKGVFPKTFEEIIQLPGIGRSTAGAICAFSYKQSYPILDGNVKRVLCRIFAIKEWAGKPEVEKKLWAIAEENLPKSDVDIYTQAIMDHGALICRRAAPLCHECPLSKNCKSHDNNWTKEIPAKKPGKILPLKRLNVLMLDNNKSIFLMKRNEKAVWKGLWSLPEFANEKALSDWMLNKLDKKSLVVKKGKSNANFSHYKLEMTYHYVTIKSLKNFKAMHEGLWLDTNELQAAAIPSPIKKLINNVMR
ncbi:MAG: A/G-specific adenine glycosylase [Methylophilaceae bacterium]|nr:A/G-specific adenine glycosylase [Methylophilaceae bacterium]MBL6726635.1 A/G-specific adenine glycosylase [Methylophilaceae bacterium]MBL6728024.1 A/G-specific adenine glycosylase [Methylophilaceae bacterium]MBL6790553.1 A/G-specific adenine glycosylase [Methylophilaceae bacterium]